MSLYIVHVSAIYWVHYRINRYTVSCIRRQNNVVSTSMRRVASTLIQRCFKVVCWLARYKLVCTYNKYSNQSGIHADPQGGIRRIEPFFFFFFFFFFLGGGGGGQNLNFNIFGGFQKNEYFWRHEDFVDNFLESSENWTGFRSHFLAF